MLTFVNMETWNCVRTMTKHSYTYIQKDCVTATHLGLLSLSLLTCTALCNYYKCREVPGNWENSRKKMQVWKTTSKYQLQGWFPRANAPWKTDISRFLDYPGYSSPPLLCSYLRLLSQWGAVGTDGVSGGEWPALELSEALLLFEPWWLASPSKCNVCKWWFTQ